MPFCAHCIAEGVILVDARVRGRIVKLCLPCKRGGFLKDIVNGAVGADDTDEGDGMTDGNRRRQASATGDAGGTSRAQVHPSDMDRAAKSKVWLFGRMKIRRG